jgi:hypothetical protein
VARCDCGIPLARRGKSRNEADGLASDGAEVVEQEALHLVQADPLLGHRVPLADRHGLVVQGLEVDGHAVGRADLVLPAVAAADLAHDRLTGRAAWRIGGLGQTILDAGPAPVVASPCR